MTCSSDAALVVELALTIGRASRTYAAAETGDGSAARFLAGPFH
jgi:hypothetical protein